MTGISSLAPPLQGFIVEQGLGRKRPFTTIVPDAPHCEHIGAMLRKGLTCGRGMIEWELRTPPGVRFSPETLAAVADRIEDGRFEGIDPCWRVEVRES
jgi:hypothetical protein